MKAAIFALGVAWLVALSDKASAGFVFDTGTVSSSDGSLNGQADFQLGNGTITVVVTNLQQGMTSQGQALSGLSFQISNPTANSVTLNSVAGMVVTVNGSGNVTSTGTTTVGQGKSQVTYALGQQTYSGSTLSSSHWSVSGTSSPDMVALSGMKPNHMILGPASSNGTYPGITGGFGNFNPYFQGPVTFVLSAPGVTSDSTISNVVFNFGTSPNEHTAPGNLVPTPAPSSLLLCGFGGLCLAGFWVISRRRIAAA